MNKVSRDKNHQTPAPPLTLWGLIDEQSRRAPQTIALLAPGRSPMTYGELKTQVDEVVASLNALGVGRNDRVAVVLPSGPEMAATFLGVASGATCAPLNPSYRRAEFDFYLTDLGASAIIIPASVDTPARDAAQRLGISVLDLTVEAAGHAGRFTLGGGRRGIAANPGLATEDDVALVLHTSGTTARPKLVPLSQRNLLASARNVSGTLRLTREDRCLNVMPLFHIHGLVGVLLSSLAAGASVVCTAGFDELQFFGWLADCHATWFSAVPTMHQSIVSQIERHPDLPGRTGVRLVRSSSASLPPHVMSALESAFQAPVIEAYGMTEAAHQISSNRLPPAVRKPGSVGVPSGPEMAIMDEAGTLLPAGQLGEVVIRGENVTLGYANNPQANQTSFSNGWFRTGDQGRCDEDGDFYLTGRLKEIINRGGEKVAPREIDEALLEHPSVAQAVTFAVPHPRLGEDVTAAVVLRAGTTASEQDLRSFLFARVADHKVPSRIVFLSAIPKGPTGKLQRIGLHAQLREALEAPHVEPSSATEQELAAIWRDLLNLPSVGARHNFFVCGGDSLLATQLVARIRTRLNVELPLAAVFRHPTLAELASAVDHQDNAAKAARERDLAEILTEVENLSDEEAKRLLDRGRPTR